MCEAIIGPALLVIIGVKPGPPVGVSIYSGPFWLGQVAADAHIKQ